MGTSESLQTSALVLAGAQGLLNHTVRQERKGLLSNVAFLTDVCTVQAVVTFAACAICRVKNILCEYQHQF